MTITIRPAKPYDASNICKMLEQAYTEQEGLYPEPSQAMVISWVTSTIINGYVLVAEKAGRIIGSTAVTDYQFPWSPRWFLSLDWAYVNTKFRRGGTFDGLMKPIHVLADEKDTPVYAGVSSGKDSLLKDKMLQMKGYQYLGGQFIREPQHG